MVLSYTKDGPMKTSDPLIKAPTRCSMLVQSGQMLGAHENYDLKMSVASANCPYTLIFGVSHALRTSGH